MRILQSHMDLLATPRPSEKEEAERQKARALVREIEEEWTGLLDAGHRGPAPSRSATRTPWRPLVLAMVVSVWRWYRPGGPMTLDEVRGASYTGRLPARPSVPTPQ